MKKQQIKNRLNVFLFTSGLCFVSLTFSVNCSALTISKKMNLEITSGTYKGQKGDAVVEYDSALVKGIGEEKIDGKITFHFLGQTVTGQPKIFLSDGKFKDVSWQSSMTWKSSLSQEETICGIFVGSFVPFSECLKLQFDNKLFNFGFNVGFPGGFPNGTNFGYLAPDTGEVPFGGFGKATYSDS